MKKTTDPPPRNVIDVLPELASEIKTTVRLHPRRAAAEAIESNKIGGMVFWPASEPWPVCDESGPPDWWRSNEYGAWPGPHGAHGPLAPLLQLRRDDFPEVEFRPGTDLLQLLWCSLDHSAPTHCHKIFASWRETATAIDPLLLPPRTIHASDEKLHECHIHPERLVEYPHSEHLSSEQLERLETWDFADEQDSEFYEALAADSMVDLYDQQLSACPSSKVGGHVAWIQRPEVPRCDRHHTMAHLLTLSDYESSGDSTDRWLATPLRVHRLG